ncbi:MAG TPA: 3-oxoadipate enol-lactonase [Alphaproteobacteria bacterium]|nr:3-oxoadipate enol-lactonase [Alphaproteobacteria bacterium]
MGFRRVNGVLLHWEEAGPPDGPVVVFSNSLGSDLRIWDEVAAALAGRFRILRYDKRGHGLSDAPPPPYGIDDHARDLTGLLDTIGVERFALVGLSVGGMIAQMIAAQAPDRVAALVLCGTAPKIGDPDLWQARIAAVEEEGLSAIADAVIARWFTDAFFSRRAEAVAGCRNMLLRTPAEGYAGTCAAIRDADLSTLAASISVPTLCLVGDEDRSTPPDLVRAAAATIPGARFGIVEGAGHLPCIEQPATLARLVGQHFQEVGLG